MIKATDLIKTFLAIVNETLTPEAVGGALNAARGYLTVRKELGCEVLVGDCLWAMAGGTIAHVLDDGEPAISEASLIRLQAAVELFNACPDLIVLKTETM